MSFYYAPIYKKVLGTSNYPIQEVTVKSYTSMNTKQPQETAVIEEMPEFHDKEDLPNLNVNLNKIKHDATMEILKDLDSRVNRRHK